MVDDTEIGEMWAKISDIDKHVALNEQSIKINRERIEGMMKEGLDKSKNDFEKWNSNATRGNNIKIAVIGVVATAIPTIITLVFR